MGIDRSLTDDFPSVVIHGRKYHYGREPTYGQHLVENAEYAKDYWCFDQKEDLLAFLTNLPESAARDWVQQHPDWHEVSHERRIAYIEERRSHLRKLMEEKQKAGTADYFSVLCFDKTHHQEVFAGSGHWSACDDLVVEVKEHEVSDGRKELLIELTD